MGGKDPLDPGLKAILESIRQTVGGEAAPASPEAAPPQSLPPPPDPPIAETRSPEARMPDTRTVEAFFADLIRPQVAAWLDAHLPEIVQALAAEEIRRLTRQADQGIAGD